jgi:hypothetical protein
VIQIMFCSYYIISTIWDKIILRGIKLEFRIPPPGVEEVQDSASKLCMFVHLTPHSVFALSSTTFIIIRVVTVQMFTDVSSTFGIQNGVVKFNSDKC